MRALISQDTCLELEIFIGWIPFRDSSLTDDCVFGVVVLTTGETIPAKIMRQAGFGLTNSPRYGRLRVQDSKGTQKLHFRSSLP